MASLSADHRADGPAVELHRCFEGAGLRYAMIGGHAVNCWVAPRVTAYFDFVVLADRDAIGRAEAALRAAGFDYDGRQDEGGPSGPEFVRMSNRETRVIIDLQTAKTSLQDGIIERAATVRESGIRVATPEDLLILKLIAGRPKDEDIHQLMSLDGLDLEFVRREAAEQGVLSRLEAITQTG